MSEEFYRKQITEMLEKADYKMIKKIYYFLMGYLGKAVE